MRNILLTFGFLVLNFFCFNIFAQPAPSTEHLKTINASSIVHTPPAESVDDLKTELTIYLLIAGVYALYWLKQRA